MVTKFMEETQGIIYCTYRILSPRILKPRKGRRAAHSPTARGGKAGFGAHSSPCEQAFYHIQCRCVGVKAGRQEKGKGQDNDRMKHDLTIGTTPLFLGRG